MRTLLLLLLLSSSVLAQNAPVYNALVTPTLVADDVTAATFNNVKVYRAIVSQSGTSAPSPVVLSNSIGEIVWARSDTGTYTATLDSAFTIGKTFCQNGFVDVTTGAVYGVAHTSVSVLTITTKAAVLDAARSDDVLSNTMIEIRVYP